MKRIRTFLIGFLLLNATTELHQFWQVPFLVSHYRYHRHLDPTLSLIKFLQSHYSGHASQPDKDADQDAQLPFKSTASLFHTDIPELTKKSITDFTLYPDTEIFTVPLIEGIPSHWSFAVFHPPRSSVVM